LELCKEDLGKLYFVEVGLGNARKGFQGMMMCHSLLSFFMVYICFYFYLVYSTVTVGVDVQCYKSGSVGVRGVQHFIWRTERTRSIIFFFFFFFTFKGCRGVFNKFSFRDRNGKWLHHCPKLNP